MREMVGTVVVADDASPCTFDHELAAVLGQPGVLGRRFTHNAGIARSLNAGLSEAISRGSQWLLTLDQDSQCSTTYVQDLHSRLRTRGARSGIPLRKSMDGLSRKRCSKAAHCGRSRCCRKSVALMRSWAWTPLMQPRVCLSASEATTLCFLLGRDYSTNGGTRSTSPSSVELSPPQVTPHSAGQTSCEIGFDYCPESCANLLRMRCALCADWQLPIFWLSLHTVHIVMKLPQANNQIDKHQHPELTGH